MGLETASFVANLVVTNPDGGDARSTADDHLRLIKAVLVRTFPKIDSAISLSAAQVHFVGDLSASVQAQLNALRDGSATANYALYANSASVATKVGSLNDTQIARLDAVNAFSPALTEVARAQADGAFYSWYVGGNLAAYIQFSQALGLAFNSVQNYPIRLYQFNALRAIITDTGITVGLPIIGQITSASYATVAGTATTAATASTATTATTAGFANTCTSASSAALLGGVAYSEPVAADTIVKRNGAGDIFARYLNQASGAESNSVGHIACMTNLDGYLRVNPIANVGAYMEARNITGRTGTAKTLSTSAPSGGNNGDIHYRY